jgi:nucleotide-binding universal stress UspA family protein
MFQKILVPINPLEDQDLLVKTASNVGIEQNAIVNFVYFGDNEEAISKLEEYIKNCTENGLTAKYESVKFNGQEKELPKKIAEFTHDCDLVIMGHLRFDKIYRFVHQSTAADLINLVSIPVMVIPEDGECEFILDKY